MDINRSVTQIKSFIDKEKKAAAGNPQPQIDPKTGLPIQPAQTGPTSATPKQEPLPKGRPRVVYWSEY